MCITGPDSQKCLLPLVWWWWVFKGRKIDKIGFQDFHPPPPVLPARSFCRAGRAGPGYSSTFVTPVQHGAWVCSTLSERVAASSQEVVCVYAKSWVKYQPRV